MPAIWIPDKTDHGLARSELRRVVGEYRAAVVKAEAEAEEGRRESTRP